MIQSNPPAVIFVNNDLTNQVKNTLIRQLHIDYVYDGYAFDQIVETDPNWVSVMKNEFNSRIMVIRDFRELQNREYADIVAFVAHGLITTEKNKFGPPIYSFQVAQIHWGQFGVYVQENSHGCCGGCNPCNPCGCSSCSCGCKCSCKCLISTGIRGV